MGPEDPTMATDCERRKGWMLSDIKAAAGAVGLLEDGLNGGARKVQSWSQRWALANCPENTGLRRSSDTPASPIVQHIPSTPMELFTQQAGLTE